MTTEIKSIEIRFKDIKIKGTLEELEELKNELGRLFQKEYFPYPTYYTYPAYHTYPQYWNTD